MYEKCLRSLHREKRVGKSFESKLFFIWYYYTYPPHSYLREVGFPDNVLEARVSRIAAYKSLYGQHQPLDQVTSSSVRSDSPKPSVSSCLVWCVSVCLYVHLLDHVVCYG